MSQSVFRVLVKSLTGVLTNRPSELKLRAVGQTARVQHRGSQMDLRWSTGGVPGQPALPRGLESGSERHTLEITAANLQRAEGKRCWAPALTSLVFSANQSQWSGHQWGIREPAWTEGLPEIYPTPSCHTWHCMSVLYIQIHPRKKRWGHEVGGEWGNS